MRPGKKGLAWLMHRNLVTPHPARIMSRVPSLIIFNIVSPVLWKSCSLLINIMAAIITGSVMYPNSFPDPWNNFGSVAPTLLMGNGEGDNFVVESLL